MGTHSVALYLKFPEGFKSTPLGNKAIAASGYTMYTLPIEEVSLIEAVSAVLAEVFSSNVACRARSPISAVVPPAGRAGGSTGLAKLASIDCLAFLGPHLPRPRPLPVLDFSPLGFGVDLEVFGSVSRGAGGGVILLGVVLSFFAPLGCRSRFFCISFSVSFSVLGGVLFCVCGDFDFSSTNKMRRI